MLNYFYLYPLTWIMVLYAYLLNFSKFNAELDSGLLLFIIFTSLISFTLGFIYKNKFKSLISTINDIKISNKPIIFLIVFSMLEFIIIKDIPFFTVALLKQADYNKISFIPLVHVMLSSVAMYYSQIYIYVAIASKEYRKKALLFLLIILSLFLLWYTRSSIMIILFSGLNSIIYYLIINKKIKIKHIVISLLVLFLGLFAFGCLGNMRYAYQWHDSSLIQKIGLYKRFPIFLPKQFMWSYSYITTPLANLNYNIINSNTKFNIFVILGQLLPTTFTKRISVMNDMNSCMLVKYYFTASTSYCSVYSNGSYIGMIIYFVFAMTIGLIGTGLYNDKLKIYYYAFCSFLSIINVFMFFDNMFYYVGISIPFWIAIIVLIYKNYQLKRRNE